MSDTNYIEDIEEASTDEEEEEVFDKKKKKCSPALLERLAEMRIKAQQVKLDRKITRAKAKLLEAEELREKSKIKSIQHQPAPNKKINKQLKVEKLKKLEEDAKRYDEKISIKQNEPISKKKIKKIVYEVSTDDEEEVVVRKVQNNEPHYQDSEDLGIAMKKAIQASLKQSYY